MRFSHSLRSHLVINHEKMKNFTLPKLGIIGTVGVPARYGGFETLTEHLIPNIKHRFDMTIYCSGKVYKKEERRKEWKGAKLHYLPLEANGIQSILYDLWSILHAIRSQDVLLILGVSGCLFLPFLKLFTKKKVIVNIDGLEWRRPKWNRYTKKFLLLSEKIACKYADEIVTDNRILKEYVNIRYGIEGNLIEYGADHVYPVKIQVAGIEKYDFLDAEYAFKVARIEPENNLHLILEAFAKLPYINLVIVGNWNNSKYGKDMRAQYGNLRNMFLLDPIYESQELNLLRSNASVYIHGHSAGGTNPSLVEAMYLGLPTISFDVIYNRVTTNNQGLFFSDVNTLKEHLLLMPYRNMGEMAQGLKAFAEKKYTWNVVAQKYGDVAAGVKPSFVPQGPKELKKRIELSTNNSSKLRA